MGILALLFGIFGAVLIWIPSCAAVAVVSCLLGLGLGTADAVRKRRPAWPAILAVILGLLALLALLFPPISRHSAEPEEQAWPETLPPEETTPVPRHVSPPDVIVSSPGTSREVKLVPPPPVTPATPTSTPATAPEPAATATSQPNPPSTPSWAPKRNVKPANATTLPDEMPPTNGTSLPATMLPANATSLPDEMRPANATSLPATQVPR